MVYYSVLTINHYILDIHIYIYIIIIIIYPYTGNIIYYHHWLLTTAYLHGIPAVSAAKHRWAKPPNATASRRRAERKPSKRLVCELVNLPWESMGIHGNPWERNMWIGHDYLSLDFMVKHWHLTMKHANLWCSIHPKLQFLYIFRI